MVLKHDPEATVLPALPEPLDSVLPADLAGLRIPHVSIHVFHDTEEFGAVWRLAERDRRLVSASTAASLGGFPAALERYARERSPDLIIIETEADTEALEYQLDSLADLCRPESRLIIIGRRNDIQLYRRLLDMGVSGYLVWPVGVAGLIAAIADIYRQPGQTKIGRVAAVLGAKGGVGTSSVAQSLALELSNRRGSDVLLVDLDLAFGTAGVDLDVDPNQGLADLIRQPERIDTDMLDRATIRCGEHLSLLGATPAFERGYEIDEESLDRIIEVAQSHVRQVVLDIPHLWAPWVERALVDSDDVVVVSTPELASLRNAVALIARIKALRPNDQPPLLALNQQGVPRRQEITARDIAQVLELHPAVTIPFDPRTFSQAASRGKMVAEMARRRPLGRAFAQLANLLDPEQAKVRRPRRRWFLGRRQRAAG